MKSFILSGSSIIIIGILIAAITFINEKNENTYQISFQNNFSFISDTLIHIVEREFQKNALAKDYIVNFTNVLL